LKPEEKAQKKKEVVKNTMDIVKGKKRVRTKKKKAADSDTQGVENQPTFPQQEKSQQKSGAKKETPKGKEIRKNTVRSNKKNMRRVRTTEKSQTKEGVSKGDQKNSVLRSRKEPR